MLSLCLWPTIILATWLLGAAAMAGAARAVGSTRGGVAVGLVAIAGLVVVGAALGWVVGQVPDGRESFGHGSIGRRPLVVGVPTAALMVQAAASFAVVRWTFGLSTLRAIAPFGALLTINVLAVAVVIGVVRPTLSASFSFPAASMSPGLEAGDRFFVSKVATPRRGDVVAFRVDVADGLGARREAVYAFRVAGLPGETLRLVGGRVEADGRVVAVSPSGDGRYELAVPGGRGSAYLYDEGEAVALGADEYFLLGDDPAIAADSRVRGPVEAGAVVGVADLIYWPPSRASVLR